MKNKSNENVERVIYTYSNLRNNKAITLVALVITIIVLLILAGIVIMQLTNSGLLKNVQLAKENTNESEAKDAINLKITEAQIKNYAEKQKMPTLQELADIFCEDEDFQYVELTTQKTASLLPVIQVGENKSIFVKLKKYNYEFEIDNEFKLASIDGIKVASNKSNDYESELITDLRYNIQIGAGTIDFNINVNNNNYVKKYIVLVNNEIKYIEDEPSGTVGGLSPNTNYQIMYEIIDIQGKIKRTEAQNIKTKSGEYLSRLVNVGDWIDYDAGIWKEGEIDSSDAAQKFTGAQVGTNRGMSITPYSSNANTYNGWRVLKISNNNTPENYADDVIYLVHAGTPIGFRESFKGDESIQLLNQHAKIYINSSFADDAEIVNETTTSPYCITNITASDSLRKTGSVYFLNSKGDTANANSGLRSVEADGNISYNYRADRSIKFGVRPVVKLKAGLSTSELVQSNTSDFVTNTNSYNGEAVKYWKIK